MLLLQVSPIWANDGVGENIEAAKIKNAEKIISLDYCADQFVLKLVDAERIKAVSKDAIRDFSYMREAAQQHQRVRPSAESVLNLEPDLIVRSYGGGPNATKFYRRLDIPVIQIGYPTTINDVKAEILRVGSLLGEADKARVIVDDMNRRLSAAKQRAVRKTVLYVTPGGITSGPGSLVDNIITTAGLENYQTAPGWRSLPIEKLAGERPDIMSTAFYNSTTNHTNYWSAARHPMIRNLLASSQSITLEGATMACGGWFLVDAVELLVAGASK